MPDDLLFKKNLKSNILCSKLKLKRQVKALLKGPGMFSSKNSNAFESYYNEWMLSNSHQEYTTAFGNMISKRKYCGLFVNSTENLNKDVLASFIEKHLKSVIPECMPIQKNFKQGISNRRGIK